MAWKCAGSKNPSRTFASGSTGTAFFSYVCIDGSSNEYSIGSEDTRDGCPGSCVISHPLFYRWCCVELCPPVQRMIEDKPNRACVDYCSFSGDAGLCRLASVIRSK